MPSREPYSRLDGFFGQLPKDLRYAMEIPNAVLLGPEYHKVLQTQGVGHVYNHWSSIPSSIAEKLQVLVASPPLSPRYVR